MVPGPGVKKPCSTWFLLQWIGKTSHLPACLKWVGSETGVALPVVEQKGVWKDVEVGAPLMSSCSLLDMNISCQVSWGGQFWKAASTVQLMEAVTLGGNILEKPMEHHKTQIVCSRTICSVARLLGCNSTFQCGSLLRDRNFLREGNFFLKASREKTLYWGWSIPWSLPPANHCPYFSFIFGNVLLNCSLLICKSLANTCRWKISSNTQLAMVFIPAEVYYECLINIL